MGWCSLSDLNEKSGLPPMLTAMLLLGVHRSIGVVFWFLVLVEIKAEDLQLSCLRKPKLVKEIQNGNKLRGLTSSL